MNTNRHFIRVLMVLAALAALAVTGCTMGYYDDGYEETYYYDDDEYVEGNELLFEDFEELDYYGQWFELMPYGYVWRPTVVMEWRPFSNGQWMWTEYGWTWVSYEPFGWATSHYGFWAYDVVWGWIWIPDYEWHPARVEWLVFDDYIAWAPLPPAGFGVGDPWVHTEIHIWHVVHVEHFTNSDIGRYHRPRSDYKSKYGRSLLKYKAPEARMVEAGTGRSIKEVLVGLKEVSAADKRYKRLALPDDEARRVKKYRDRTARKISPKQKPHQPTESRTMQKPKERSKSFETDRIQIKRDRRDRPEVKERKKQQRKDPPKREKAKPKVKEKKRPTKQEPKQQPQKKPAPAKSKKKPTKSRG